MGRRRRSLRCLISSTTIVFIVVTRNAVTSSAFLLQKSEVQLYSLGKSSRRVLICLDAGNGQAPEKGERQWKDDDDWYQLSSYGGRPREDSSPEDDDIYRSFQEGVDEPGGIDTRTPTGVEEAEQRRDIRETMSGSLDFIAVAVGLFFVVTVVFTGGSLFATSPSSTTSPSRIVNADALLREDFDRAGTSVYFSSDSEGAKGGE